MSRKLSFALCAALAIPVLAQSRPDRTGLPNAARLKRVVQDVVRGSSPAHDDNMILDFKNNYSPSGFGHPSCKGGTNSGNIIANLSKQFRARPHRH